LDVIIELLIEGSEVMFGNIKTEGILLNMEAKSFVNKTTGEITEMTLVRYLIPTDSTEEFKGGVILECYTKKDAFTKLEKIMFQKSVIELMQKPTQNGSKYVLYSVNNIDLKK